MFINRINTSCVAQQNNSALEQTPRVGEILARRNTPAGLLLSRADEEEAEAVHSRNEADRHRADAAHCDEMASKAEAFAQSLRAAAQALG